MGKSYVPSGSSKRSSTRPRRRSTTASLVNHESHESHEFTQAFIRVIRAIRGQGTLYLGRFFVAKNGHDVLDRHHEQLIVRFEIHRNRVFWMKEDLVILP